MADGIVKVYRAFAKHEGSQTVSCAVDIHAEIGGVQFEREMVDEYHIDADLQAYAEAQGKTTWDEDDICAVGGYIRLAAWQASQSPPADPPSPEPA